MAIQFFGSPEPTIGVEIEIQLIDPETRDLTPKSIALLELCRTRGIERVKAEITQSMVEIDTEISNDVKECRIYLDKRMGQIRGVAQNLGLHLAVSGTHPYPTLEPAEDLSQRALPLPSGQVSVARPMESLPWPRPRRWWR